MLQFLDELRLHRIVLFSCPQSLISLLELDLQKLNLGTQFNNLTRSVHKLIVHLDGSSGRRLTDSSASLFWLGGLLYSRFLRLSRWSADLIVLCLWSVLTDTSFAITIVDFWRQVTNQCW